MYSEGWKRPSVRSECVPFFFLKAGNQAVRGETCMLVTKRALLSNSDSLLLTRAGDW